MWSYILVYFFQEGCHYIFMTGEIVMENICNETGDFSSSSSSSSGPGVA
jgi:hypothetical protein